MFRKQINRLQITGEMPGMFPVPYLLSSSMKPTIEAVVLPFGFIIAHILSF